MSCWKNMKEPRKIVLILGNGFDLDLGLKTSYKDFWESEYCPKDYPAPLINHLNLRWSNNRDAVRWYDLENELLNYYNIIRRTIRIQDVITDKEKEFVQVVNPAFLSFGIEAEYEDAANSLLKKRYLIRNPRPASGYQIPYRDDMMKPHIWRDRRALVLIKEGLCKYLQSINYTDSVDETVAFQLLLSMIKSADAGDFIDIFTFNYTRIQIRGIDLENIPIHYMHGNCETGNVIIGTRDDSGINPDYDFLMKAMDFSFTPPDIVTALKEADEIIIFGHSLGENDRQYFAPFFLRQSDYNNPSRKDTIIFTRDNNSMVEIKRALQKMTNGNLSTLFSINQPIIIRTNNLSEDKQQMKDFLINHHTDKHYAMEVINKLLQ